MKFTIPDGLLTAVFGQEQAVLLNYASIGRRFLTVSIQNIILIVKQQILLKGGVS